MGFRQITGLTQIGGSVDVPVSSIPGDTGAGPVTFTIIATASNVQPNNPLINMLLFPGPLLQSGSDSLGQIGVSGVYGGTGDDKTYVILFDGAVNFPDGFWNSTIVVGVNDPNAIIDITIVFDSPDLTAYDPTLVDIPENLTLISTTYDPDADRADVTMSFDYTNADAEDPTSLAILRDGIVVGSVPWTDGTTHYEYTDAIFGPSGDYTYTVIVYKYSDGSKSGESVPLLVSFGGVIPDIDIIGSGGIVISGAALMQFIADASGIYKLVADKTNDTLYDRTGDTITTVDVKIPDPFIKTGFIGG